MVDNGQFDTIVIDRVELQALREERDEYREKYHNALGTIRRLEAEFGELDLRFDSYRARMQQTVETVYTMVEKVVMYHVWTHERRNAIDQLIMYILEPHRPFIKDPDDPSSGDIPF